ncbi:MAG TPA: LpqB family beta-propeller domain-containing protein, partial [Vicinamibacterales bacterium]|nr:LpqB family beta-propeller domain-containing protein [Vicinamibacterales bacterium]
MTKTVMVACGVLAAAVSVSVHAQIALPKVPPTVDQILSLKRVGAPAISPDGRWVAYTVRETNWDDNAYETEIFVADASGGAPRQLTNAKKSSRSPAWSPDGSKLAFISDRTDKSQIYVINPTAGEAEAVTSVDDGVNSFEWAPDSKRIAYTATEPKSAAVKDREKKYGEFKVVEQDYRMSQLFVIDLATKRTQPLASGPYTVGSFEWSPDGTRIAFDHRVNPSPGFGGSADISIV